MIGNISSSQAGALAAQYSGPRNVPPPSNPASTPAEDTVQLSSQFQGLLASKQASTQPPPTLDQTIKEAAGGDITALARLALVA